MANTTQGALTEKKLPSGGAEWCDAKGKRVKKVTTNGQVQWFDDDGQFHRDDGPAIENADGSRMWMQHGKEHREDGPAIEAADRKEWYRNGKRHRDDGPAVERSDGQIAWYRNGKKLTPEQIRALSVKKGDQLAKTFLIGTDRPVTQRRGIFKNPKKRTDKK